MSWRTHTIALVTSGIALLATSLATEPLLRSRGDDEIAIRLHLLGTRQPQVVFLGSSLFQAGIRPEVIETDLELPTGSVLNLAGPSMGVWEAAAIVARTPGSLEGVRVVLELDPWYLNAEQWHPILHEPVRAGESFYRWALWEDRWAHREGDYVSVVLSGLLPVLRLRQPVQGWLRQATRAGSAWPEAVPPPKYHLDDAALQERLSDTRFAPEVISTWHLKNYRHDPARLQRLSRLVEDIRSRGGDPMILVMPLKPSYFSDIRGDAARWAEFERSQQAVKQLESHVRLLHYPDPTAAGLTPDDYVDYGHLSRSGSMKFSHRLGTDLAETW